MIYLDNAATTFPKPDVVINAVEYCQRNFAVNVGRGTYSLASKAMKVVDETRMLLASMVGISNPDRVVLTPSATIAANEIIMGLPWDHYKTVYVSPFEHNAIARPLNKICVDYGIKLKMLPFDNQTQLWNQTETKKLFELDPPDYVFLNHVSNVTGVVVPVSDIAALSKEYGACVIVDASQSMGLINIDMTKSHIDYMIFAGHKNLYASWGVGGFIACSSVIHPAICGGTGSDSLNLSMTDAYPIGYEAGSPNIIAIASLNASLKWIMSIGVSVIADRKKKLMENLVSGLSRNNVILYLPADLSQHTSVISLNVNGYEPNEVGTILGEEYDIAVRTGFHCAPFVHSLIGTEACLGTVRISLSYFNTEEDINKVVKAISEL